MKSILLVGTIEALFLLFLILKKKDKKTHDFFLSAIFLINTLSIGFSYIEILNHENGFKYPLFINIAWLFLLLQGPALWFYIKSLSIPKFKLKFYHSLHLLPFLIFGIWHFISFISAPVDYKINLAENESFTSDWFYKSAVIAIGISNIAYNIWALLLIKSHKEKAKQVFSNLQRTDLKWLKILTIATLSIYIINAGIFNLDLIYDIGSYKNLILISYSYGSIYILILAYFGLHQKNVFVKSYFPEEKSFNKKLNNSKKDELQESLLNFMKKEKPFLNPDLTIGILAKQINTTSEKLSLTLNKSLNQNFYDFVNKYRVEEFKKQAINTKNKQFSILGIAYDCGFNSKAAFYRAFKKFENLSPTAFIYSHKQNSETNN